MRWLLLVAVLVAGCNTTCICTDDGFQLMEPYSSRDTEVCADFCARRGR